MGVDPLDEACTLAFEVAREGVEANPPVDPPAPMRNFLYVAHLPRRAMSVARQVIDDDPDFRARVAAEATEARIGRAGVLWLERSDGWEAEFGSLIGESAPAASPPPPPPPGPDSQRPAAMPVHERPAAPPPPDLDASQQDIETELASLRDLVDRLADERQSVGATVEVVETDIEEKRVESMTGAAETGAELEKARVDRNAAETGKDEAVARQAALEQELGELRVELVEVRRQLGEIEHGQTAAESALGAAETAVASLETRISELEDEQEELRHQLELVTVERDEVTQNLAELRDDRDGLAERVGVAEQARLDVEVELEDMTSKHQDLHAEVGDLGEQKIVLEVELEELRRLQESSERARRELFSDLGAQLERAEAERDLLASKLEVAHERLGGTRTALDSATTTIGSELDGADAAFAETKRAATDLEQVFGEAAERINQLEAETLDSAERETLVEVSDEAEAPSDEVAPATDEGTESSASSESADRQRRGSELDEVLASYGLGAEPAGGKDDERSDTAVDEPTAAGQDDDGPVQAVEPIGDEPTGAEQDDDGPAQADEPDTVRLPVGGTTADSTGAPVDRTSARRQIAPITGDPVDVARNAVSAADVVLLLDGDPIASLGWPTLEVARRRDALVSYLGDLAAETGAASDVVFDGRVGDETNLPVSRAVRVRLTNTEVEPTAAIAELVDDYPTQWPVAVVSDDTKLAERAAAQGATVLDNGQLLDLFISS